MGGVVDAISDVGRKALNTVTLGGYDAMSGGTWESGWESATMGLYQQDKTGGDKVETPASMTTSTSVGNKLDAVGKTYNPDEEESKRKAVNKKRLGTRGLQIPMTAPDSTTTSTPSTTGIQL